MNPSARVRARRTVGTLAVVVCTVVSLTAAVAEPPARFGVCEREIAKLARGKPVRAGRPDRPPKKLRHVSPKYPALPANSVVGGMWIGEALIDEKGKVSRVWTIRGVEITPPFPAVDASIVEAIEQWEFEPRLVKGKPAPACVAVTVNIDFP